MTDATEGLDRMVWVDLETMGLEPTTDPVIEIGFRITDNELRTIDDLQLIVWDSPYFDKCWDDVSDYVRNMHELSGILEEKDTGTDVYTIPEAHDRVMTFLTGHGIQRTEPLCGSSVQFDRSMLDEQYPDVSALFSYRNIDISTLKELCRRLNPGVYSRLEEVAPAKKAHRVLSDLEDTINEFRFYRDEFLIW